MTLKVLSLAAIAVAAFTAPALGHHSFTMFDETRPTTLSGTVRDFEWTNPHAWLRVMVKDEKTGKSVVWAYELSSTARLITMGMSANSLKAGDMVSVTFHPMRDGTRAGRFIQATLANGKTVARADARSENEEP